MRRAPVALVVAALGFYLWTLAPGLLWGDSAKFQRMAWQGEIRFDATGHPLWVALVHPLTLTPGLDPARAANLSSALFSALAIWPAFLAARRLGAGSGAAILACSFLAVSHTWWMHAVAAEVYAFNSLLSLIVLAALLKPAGESTIPRAPRSAGACLLLGILYGAGCGNHLILTLWLAGLIWLAPSRLAFASGAGAGLAPFLLMRLTLDKGESLGGLAARVGAAALSPLEAGKDLLAACGYLLYQFPTLVVIAAAAAGAASLARRTAIGLLSLAVPTALFGAIYPVRDRFAFLLPCYILVALAAARGLDRLADRFRTRRARAAAMTAAALLVAAQPPIYFAAGRLAPPALARLGAWAAPRELPFRNAVFAHLYPGRRGDDGARRFVEGAFATMPDRAVLLADYTALEPLLYAQRVEGRRPDVDILYMSPRWQLRFALDKSAEGREVFLAAADAYYDVQGISSRYALVAAGPLHRLAPLHTPSED